MLKKFPHRNSSILTRRGGPELHPAAVDVGVHALVRLKHLPAAIPQGHRGGQRAGEMSRI